MTRKKRKPEPPPPPPRFVSRTISFGGQQFPSVAFRPDRPVEAEIIKAIDASKKSIYIAAYEFNLEKVLEALRRAKARGVQIRIVVDHSNVYPRKRSDSDYVPRRKLQMQALFDEGFDVRVLRGMWKYGIMHNKFMIFDGKLAEHGSYNYSWTAENHHYEMARFTDNQKDVKSLMNAWVYMRGLAKPFAESRAYDWPKELDPPPTDPNHVVRFNGVDFPAWVFSPGGGGEDWVVRAIQSAQKSIDLSAFTLRSVRILEALKQARARNKKLKIRVIVDRSQAEQDTVKAFAGWLAYHDIDVRTLSGPHADNPEHDPLFEKNHNKLMVIDDALVAMGSMNHTKNASLMNFENLAFFDDAKDAAATAAYFDDMFKAAEKIAAPAAEPKLPTDAELEAELRVEPEPPPPPTVWPTPPPSPTVNYHGLAFPSVAMRPYQPIKPLLVRAIDKTKKTLKIALYEFEAEQGETPEVLEALRRAKARGVKVTVVIDLTQGLNPTGRPRSREVQALIDEGFDIRALRGINGGIMHHKFAIFDEKMIQFGSYNWKDTSENNHFEDVAFSTEEKRIDFYDKIWDYLTELAVPVEELENVDWSQRRPGTPPADKNWDIEFNGRKFPRTMVSPQGGIQEVLLLAIQAAQKTIQIGMFAFYSQPIADALLKAKQRGVKVQLVLDDSQAKTMVLDSWFAFYNFDVKIVAGPNEDGNVKHEKMHHKFMIVDEELLAMGSYNYTAKAENSNFDNINIFSKALDPERIAYYLWHFGILHQRGWKPRKPPVKPVRQATPGAFFSEDIAAVPEF